jgi:hypothetical protein
MPLYLISLELSPKEKGKRNERKEKYGTGQT